MKMAVMEVKSQHDQLTRNGYQGTPEEFVLNHASKYCDTPPKKEGETLNENDKPCFE